MNNCYRCKGPIEKLQDNNRIYREGITYFLCDTCDKKLDKFLEGDK